MGIKRACGLGWARSIMGRREHGVEYHVYGNRVNGKVAWNVAVLLELGEGHNVRESENESECKT